MTARIHNAKACTIDGSDCWCVVLYDDRGRFSCHPEDAHEAASLDAAKDWAVAELARRGFPGAAIEVRR